MIALDPSGLVRYIAQDDPVQSALATAWIEEQLSASPPGDVSSVVPPELHWVLTQRDAIDRQPFVDLARALMSAQALPFDHLQAAWNAAQACEDGHGFVAALLAELGEAAGCTTTATFDMTLASHATAQLHCAAT